jgi:hypothetical protein
VSAPTSLARLRAWLASQAPIPMAAPEPPALRQARLRIVAALALLAVLGAAWDLLARQHGPLLLALLAGLGMFLALQIPLWMRAKARTDDAWLMRDQPQAEQSDA